jgi:protein gp37
MVHHFYLFASSRWRLISGVFAKSLPAPGSGDALLGCLECARLSEALGWGPEGNVAGKSQIEWTENTWNPVTGCTQVSPGCDHCYAMRLVNVRQVNNPRSPRYGHPFDEVMLHANRLDQPSRWKSPTRIFVNSMSDVFHKDVPDAFIDRIFDEMERNAHHVFQVLTKRAERMKRYANKRYEGSSCPAHIWLGVSVENIDYAWRAKMLKETAATVRWISAEPLIGSLSDLQLAGIDWLVAGGESGPGARAMDAQWVRELRDRCKAEGVKFFFKQWGGETKKGGGDKARLDGRRWTQYPNRRSKRAA